MKKPFIYLIITFLIIIYLKSLVDYILQPHLTYYDENALINYSAGFVRRGLSGEIIKSIFYYTKIKTDIIIKVLNLFSISIITFYFFQKFKKENVSFLILLLPYSLAYLFKEDSVAFKDLINLIFIIISIIILRKQYYLKYIYINILGVLAILNHEMYLFQIFAVFIILNTKEKIYYNILYLTPCIITFIICYLHKGNTEQALIIGKDINNIIHNYPYNKVDILEDNINIFRIKGNFLSIHNGFSRGIIYLCFFFNLIYITLNSNKLKIDFNKINLNNKLLTISLLILIIVQLPIFIIADDWFRFININLLIALVITINFNNYELKYNKLVNIYYSKISKFYNYILSSNRYVVLLIAFFTIIPHYKLGNTPYQFSNTYLILINYLTKIIDFI